MGRHSTPGRRRGGVGKPVVITAGLLALALVGWLGYGFVAERLGGPDCAGAQPLAVSAAPEIASVVDAAARRFAEADPCAKVVVSSRASSVVAEELVVSESGEYPDVWIPESARWLQHAQSSGAWDVPVTGTSVASSPVVLAVIEDTARELGWPDTALTWESVLSAEQGSVGLPDPSYDPVGVSALLGIQTMTSTQANPGAAATALMRALSPNTLPKTADLFTRLPGGGSEAKSLTAFPSSEVSLIKHNARQGFAPLVAAYAEVPALDFPFTVLPRTAPAGRDLAQRFLGALVDPAGEVTFADAGFRSPSGAALRDRSQDERTTAVPQDPVALPAPDDVDVLLNRWAGVNKSARVQVLLDVSGSMAEPVPGTGTDRMGITLRAAELGLKLFKPTTRYGMWLFSTRLDGDRDYREVIPMATVGDHLDGDAVQTLRGVKALENGATGLYDSVLAAYRSSRQNWEPGRINLVIVLTDGKNEDSDGISRQALLAELAKLQDPRRPLQIIGIGIGPDIDSAELKSIAEATGGQAFTTPDPTKIGDIFYAALAKLSG
ncbi:substrate-binding and VWA domain-containing protein [Actinokineospora guangxiensis]|uniref:Substrate-binding and VWA domain-containing protein n=1 Tax=Actinokineospora guangxiensis TaxID=1490288 RepID=A0ABW0EM29_9PSEU